MRTRSLIQATALVLALLTGIVLDYQDGDFSFSDTAGAAVMLRVGAAKKASIYFSSESHALEKETNSGEKLSLLSSLLMPLPLLSCESPHLRC